MHHEQLTLINGSGGKKGGSGPVSYHPYPTTPVTDQFCQLKTPGMMEAEAAQNNKVDPQGLETCLPTGGLKPLGCGCQGEDLKEN